MKNIDLQKLIAKNRVDGVLPVSPATNRIARYSIDPVAKPRMTRRDKWQKRDCVMRYRAFCDELRDKRVQFKSGDHIRFILPMPDSWSARKRMRHDGKPHESKPDLDNLVKAVCDALYDNDSAIWDFRATKVWGIRGEIVIQEI